MPKQFQSIRVTDKFEKEVNRLKEELGISITAVIYMAVAQLYRNELEMPRMVAQELAALEFEATE